MKSPHKIRMLKTCILYNQHPGSLQHKFHKIKKNKTIALSLSYSRSHILSLCFRFKNTKVIVHNVEF